MEPNIVLLTVDSLRADHATQEGGLMPRLTQHATDGVQFTRAYANGYSTAISFPTILTGTYPDHYGGHGYISDNRPALAAKFQTAGYKTAGFHTNPHLLRKKNYDRGFGTYGDFNDEAGQFSWIRYLTTQNLDNDSLSYKLLKRIYHFLRTTSGTSDYAKAPKLNQKAVNWLDQNYGGESPFFLWIHYMDVHYPFYPPDKYLIDNSTSSKRAISLNGKMHEENTELSDADINDLKTLYRGEVRYTDHYIGELLEDMKKRDLFDETIFIITSDHGELFGEHELFGHPPSGYEESFHVPFVMFGPGIAEDRQVDRMSSLLDLPPTVADLSGLDIDPNWEGESLLKYIQTNRGASKKGMYLGDTDVLSYQTNEWRLTWWRTRDNPEHPEQEWELWKLPECERIPLAEQKTVVERFREKLRGYLDRTKNQEELSKPAIDRMTEQRLEALGYR